MKKVTNIIFILLVAMYMTGCASYLSYQSSRKEIVTSRALASGDEVAIKAVRLGSDGVGIGIVVNNWEALTHHPFRQLGAAVLDVGMLYAIYEAVVSLDKDDNDNDTSTTSDSTVNINFSGNEQLTTDITIGDYNGDSNTHGNNNDQNSQGSNSNNDGGQ